MMVKVILTGAESTGKTTLCRQLAKHFNASFIIEYARKYIDNLNREYARKDLIKIAKGQLQLENRYNREHLLFCDTDLITLKIWSNYKYQKCDQFILNQLKKQKKEKRVYLLCEPDIDWKNDNQREHPTKREKITLLYKKELKKLNRKFTVISGNGILRFENAINILNKIL